MGNDSKVIPFNNKDRPGISVNKHPKIGCGHKHVLVDETSRMLTCEDCDLIIDPYDFMLDWAYGDDHLHYLRQQLKKEIKKLSNNLEDLKRQERNIKARIRNAMKK